MAEPGRLNSTMQSRWVQVAVKRAELRIREPHQDHRVGAEPEDLEPLVDQLGVVGEPRFDLVRLGLGDVGWAQVAQDRVEHRRDEGASRRADEPIEPLAPTQEGLDHEPGLRGAVIPWRQSKMCSRGLAPLRALQAAGDAARTPGSARCAPRRAFDFVVRATGAEPPGTDGPGRALSRGGRRVRRCPRRNGLGRRDPRRRSHRRSPRAAAS